MSPSNSAAPILVGAVVALFSVWITWQTGQAEVTNVTRAGAWNVSFSTGDAIRVPIERDTLTTEAVLRSGQVEAALERIDRRRLPMLTLQGTLIFFGVAFGLHRIQRTRNEKITP